MRKLKLQVQVTLDGFVAGPKGEMDWLVWNWDDDLKDYVNEITEPIDCIVLGRVLAQGFIDAWASRAANPEHEGVEFINKMNDTAKVVFSKTLRSVDWKDTTLAKGNIVTEITQLKNQPGSDIIAYGGARFISSLIKHNLIDEYHLFENPVAIGKGMPIFDNVKGKLNLNLVKASSFKCGIVVLHYEPKRN